MVMLLAGLAFAGPPYHACDTGHDGSVVFIDPASREVFRYTDHVASIGTLAENPKSRGWAHMVFIGDEGQVFAGWHSGEYQRVTPEGMEKAKLPWKGIRKAEWAADVAPDGSIVVGHIHGVVANNEAVVAQLGTLDISTLSGELTREQWMQLGELSGVSVADDGTVLAFGFLPGQGELVVIVAPDGSRQVVSAPEGRHEIIGVTKGPRGTFLVASTKEGSCLYSLGGESWTAVGGVCPEPAG
jgi:hypothetical protein